MTVLKSTIHSFYTAFPVDVRLEMLGNGLVLLRQVGFTIPYLFVIEFSQPSSPQKSKLLHRIHARIKYSKQGMLISGFQARKLTRKGTKALDRPT